MLYQAISYFPRSSQIAKDGMMTVGAIVGKVLDIDHNVVFMQDVLAYIGGGDGVCFDL